jgi:hypothetical protein
MWIMLMQTTTSAWSTGQASDAASSASARRILVSPEATAQASMLARADASESLG